MFNLLSGWRIRIVQQVNRRGLINDLPLKPILQINSTSAQESRLRRSRLTTTSEASMPAARAGMQYRTAGVEQFGTIALRSVCISIT